ncbi:glycerate kinase [Leifsonia sp. NCR5]|uniref:glycerate kinase n=1 Tax=Leifsonia sp. NCR5 TaxID=1978342 RepID=UPI000A191A4C|nr:glycerate kinase [Leifsonia sp. NCR5]
MPYTVVVAPDSFKGSATATAVAEALASGWSSVRSDDRLVLAPMADGGEGTLDAFEVAVPGSVRHAITVLGPAGADLDASWLSLPDGTAVVELAETSGLAHLPTLAPLDAHTYGFGQAIAAALASGATGLLLAIGGSSSTDGGVGALAALGAHFTDPTGRPIRLGNRGLGTLAKADLSGLPPLPPGGVRILSDVTNPLLGPTGAAAVFGPQKGATPEQAAGMESGLARLARVLGGGRVRAAAPDAGAERGGRQLRATTPGAGAAGGTGYGLLAWGASLAPGSAAVGDALGLPALVATADVVITGEGRFDSQSAAGKVPAYVSHLARDAGVPALLAAGAIQAPTDAFAAAVSLTELAGSADAAIADPQRWAREAGAVLARQIG